MNITANELLEALAASQRSTAPEDARTVRELMGDSGLSELRVKRVLRDLQECGRLQAHRVTRTGIDGRAAKVPAYTILPAA